MKSFLPYIFIFLFFSTANAQEVAIDSLETVVDSLSAKEVKKRGFIGRFWHGDRPSPKKATILSLILPGAGQVYNKKYWKLPIVYGAGYLLYRAIDFNQSEYDTWAEIYDFKTDDDPETIDIAPSYSSAAARSIRDQYDKYRQQSYIGMFFLYVLTAVDSYVGAHLATFDVDDDLSLHIDPTFDYTPTMGPQLGIGVVLRFDSKKDIKPVAIP